MTETPNPAPIIDRPDMPDGYGVPEDSGSILPWSWAEQQLKDASNYWFSTTRPNGQPHAVPAWAVLVDGDLYFEGSPATIRARNIAANPALTIHLESGSTVVIVEGVAREAGGPPPELAAKLVQEFERKYGGTDWDYHPALDQWAEGGLWAMRPRKVIGWSQFPTTVTRWRFPDA